MTTNDRIILNEVLKQRHAEVDPNSPESRFFELFTVEQILKDSDLSYDEIESGLIGDGGDGGIDGMYMFVNGELVQEDPDYTHLKKNITLDLILIQAKTASGFAETPVERFITVSDDILNLAQDPANFSTVYNDAMREGIARFREVHNQLVPRFPTFRVVFYYACKGISPATGVTHKVQKLKESVNKHFPSAKCSFHCLGASELLELARRAPQTTYTLTLAENPISSEGQIGLVCLVRLKDFYTFITDDQGALRRHIFEANVRDYQGRTEVNDEIQQSLQEKNPEDFWWLNNGVSIVASKASQSGKTLTIEDPQIVNGLQTSAEVYNYCKKFNTEKDERKILVRVIVPTEEGSRDRIIKATNSQTPVQMASLRATDKIHRNIEEYLRPRGLFYDRRKNYYKNEGKPRDKIIGIPHLAQAVMAIVLQRPDTARARPSSLLKRDDDYAKVYNPNYPIQLYHVCAEGTHRVEEYLKRPEIGIDPQERSNLRFYVAMYAVVSLTAKPNPNIKEVAEADLSLLDDNRLKQSLDVVKIEYAQLGGNDQVAKGKQLVEAVRKHLPSK